MEREREREKIREEKVYKKKTLRSIENILKKKRERKRKIKERKKRKK